MSASTFASSATPSPTSNSALTNCSSAATSWIQNLGIGSLKCAITCNVFSTRVNPSRVVGLTAPSATTAAALVRVVWAT